MKLYVLATHFRALADRLLQSETGELSDTDLASLNELEMAMPVKIGSCVAVYRELETEAEGIKAEADRLAKLAKARMNAADRLKAYVRDCMDEAGIPSIKTDLGKVQVQEAGRPSIKWTGTTDEIPDDYKRVKVEFNGEAAYQTWKALGTLPEGCEVKKSRFIRVY